MPLSIRLIMRSFAPFSEFGHMAGGGGYEGDNRGFSADVQSASVTSRIKQTLTINFDTRLAAQSVESSHSETRGYISGAAAMGTGVLCEVLKRVQERDCQPHEWHDGRTVRSTAIPTGGLSMSATGNDMAIQHWYSGSLPLMAVGAPDIDVQNQISFTRTTTSEGTTTLSISGHMTGDGFPNAELLLVDTTRQSIFLHTFPTAYGCDEGPMLALAGDFRRNMGHYGLTVTLTSQGAVSSILYQPMIVTSRYCAVGRAEVFTPLQWNSRFISSVLQS